MRRIVRRPRRRRFRRFVPGRKRNRPRNVERGLYSILVDYVSMDGEEPVYTEEDIERVFRVPRLVFMRVYKDVQTLPFFEQRVSATGSMALHPLQKMVAAFLSAGVWRDFRLF